MFLCPASLTWLLQFQFIVDLIAVVNRIFFLLPDFLKKLAISPYKIKCAMNFRYCTKILPKLNSIHVPNNEHIQLEGKTLTIA